MPIKNNRKTKIVCTIGPKTCSKEMLTKLAVAGMNVVRLNMSHGTHEWHAEVIQYTKELRTEGWNLALMLDTKGPEIRTGDIKQPLQIQQDDTITFTTQKLSEYPDGLIQLNYDAFIDEVSVGDVIFVDGGVISLEVISKNNTDIVTKALDNGTITSRRHLNIRGKSANLPAITEKDWEDIDFGISHDIDYYALSFTNDAATVIELRDYLKQQGSTALIISKIESAKAIDNLDSILSATDGVMVARGDLGAELPYEDVPIVQNRIVDLCRQLNKPVIVATQMLESMMTTPIPTRAEVTDIYVAVSSQADAIMLSGETANGDYPVKAVKVMDAIAQKTEASHTIQFTHSIQPVDIDPLNDIGEISLGATTIANKLNADAIIVFSKTGGTARMVSKNRPHSPMYIFCGSEQVTQQMSLVWGTTSFTLPFNEDNPDATIEESIEILKTRNYISSGNQVVIVSNILSAKQSVHAVQVRRIV